MSTMAQTPSSVASPISSAIHCVVSDLCCLELCWLCCLELRCLCLARMHSASAFDTAMPPTRSVNTHSFRAMQLLFHRDNATHWTGNASAGRFVLGSCQLVRYWTLHIRRQQPIRYKKFHNLLLLDLSDCQLASWETQIQPFGGLPKLESLVLNNNFIETINITTATNVDQVAFSSLASMQLAGNPISTWTALDGINAIPRLRSRRLRNTPLTESMGVGEVRSTAIARFPNLEYFNASPISERERLEAERRYVSSVARELLLISSEALLSGEVTSSASLPTTLSLLCKSGVSSCFFFDHQIDVEPCHSRKSRQNIFVHTGFLISRDHFIIYTH